MFNCKFCNKDITTASTLSFHEKRCDSNPNKIVTEITYIKCPKCNKDVNSRGVTIHHRYCKYKQIKIPCEVCGILHNGEYGSGRFCSCKCARTFCTMKGREEINVKVSNTLKLRQRNKKIPFRKRCLHLECILLKLRVRKNKSDSSRESVNKRILAGTHKGWNSRNVLSYPEKFFIQVLENNGFLKNEDFIINYKVPQRDLGINSNYCYFLDFYFPKLRLDLEIDGKQHTYKDRVLYDKRRDEALMNKGYQVHRISWKNPVNTTNKEYIALEIKKLLCIIL